jgi:phosphatidylglycerol---prolipoprotein diacylglyceryl transferase
MLPFNLPLLHRPILWYGFLFAVGFFLSYWTLLFLLEKMPKFSTQAKPLAERITLYVVVGTLIGARLGDLLFYQNWSDYVHDPLMIVKVWEGGLASHGGAVGIVLALYFLSLRKKMPAFLTLLDLIAAVAGIACFFIRIGNFFNQEILGKVTTVPWAIVFGHPIDRSAPLPRHPVQLYEAVFYLFVFFLLFFLWQKRPYFQKPGKASGLFLTLVFGFRFMIEFLKEEQSYWMMGISLPLNMGQYLSLPLIALGLYLLFLHKNASEGES